MEGVDRCEFKCSFQALKCQCEVLPNNCAIELTKVVRSFVAVAEHSRRIKGHKGARFMEWLVANTV